MRKTITVLEHIGESKRDLEILEAQILKQDLFSGLKRSVNLNSKPKISVKLQNPPLKAEDLKLAKADSQMS